jgi:predicted nucleic acid-binding protein
MIFSSCLTDEDKQLALDSSVIINLLATGSAAHILRALAVPVFIAESVVDEIGRGQRNELNALNELIGGQLVRVPELSEVALQTFANLVSGNASVSLGDGEAATIAIALAMGCSAIIDEKKATKLAAQRYARLRLATTVDVLSHPVVMSVLGRTTVAEATLKSLRDARMQVREHQFDWVADLIGADGITECPSLRRLARQRETMRKLKATG